MQELAPQRRCSNNIGEVNRDAKMQQALDALEIENSRLRTLVVQLSETIIKNVVAKR